MESKTRQAVVIIHGIGEQKPMSTLRGFVSTLTSNPSKGDDKEIKFYSKPDDLSKSFELRRLTTAEKDGRPKTDFFEYYWAHTIRDTKLQQVLIWFLGVVWRWPWSLPKRIIPVHLLIWTLLLTAIALFLTGFVQVSPSDKLPVWIKWSLAAASAITSYVLTNYLGDAARYTSANAANIAGRQKIRADGITLLRELHTSGKYSKIVIVGHSLGSIIGYDLIRHLWCEFNDRYQDARFKEILLEFESKYAKQKFENFNVSKYRRDQERLLVQQQNDGNPWLISDFVTLGSPLTYSSFLLAKNKKELLERIQERELPISPPVPEVLDDKFRITYKPQLKSGRRVLHHASPFACTKWTNIYFKNDLVGGPVAEYYGPGIEEHEVKLEKDWFNSTMPFRSHTRYWADSNKDKSRCEQVTRIVKKIIDF